MQSVRFRTVVVIALLILTPFLIRWGYLHFTALRDEIRMATGPEHGEWRELSLNLKRSIESKTPVAVGAPLTEGSVQHLELLQGDPEAERVDFALYMRGSRRLKHPDAPPLDPPPMLVGNLYSDYTFFLVRRDLHESGDLCTPEDLDNREAGSIPFRVAVGALKTGEHTIAQAILDYYFGDERGKFTELPLNYTAVEDRFKSDELDAALITAGPQAPIFENLIQSGSCVVAEIPHVDAIVMKNVGLKKVQVPQGLFRYGKDDIPGKPMSTVASQTMLLTREDTDSKMVEEVARILLSEDFIQDNQLFELSQGGAAYATANPEFALHPGALRVYDPGLKPLVDPDFMEFTENFRSFGVSLLIGGFLVYQWYKRSRDRRIDHRLDEYFAELLAIDGSTWEVVDDTHHAEKLQESLLRVIALRNEALGEFSAKDFEEDTAADSFLHLCDSVADGFRSHLARLQMQQGFRQLTGEWKRVAESVRASPQGQATSGDD